jgi:hypothetical protein
MELGKSRSRSERDFLIFVPELYTPTPTTTPPAKRGVWWVDIFYLQIKKVIFLNLQHGFV